MARRHHGREFWAALVEESRRQGATVAMVAKRNGVSPRTLGWWRWRLRRDAGEDGGRARGKRRPRGSCSSTGLGTALPVRVLPVEVTDTGSVVAGERCAADVGLLELVFEEGLVLRFSSGVDPAYLGALLRSLRAPC